MVVRYDFSILKSLVIADDRLGEVARVETDSTKVIPGFETMDFGSMCAVEMVGGKGKRVVREVDVILVEGFAEEEGMERPDMETRQVPGL